MSTSSDSLAAWEPTEQQLAAAQYLAGGYTQQRAADAAHCALRTLQYWLTNTPLPEIVAGMRREIRETQEPQFQRSIELAQRIVTGALDGDFRADDPRVLLAERILSRTLYRVIVMEARGSGRNVPEEPIGLPYGRGGNAA